MYHTMDSQPMQPNLGDVLRRLETSYPPAKRIIESKGCAVEGNPVITMEQVQSLLLHPELTLPLGTLIKSYLLPSVVKIVDEAFLHNGNAHGRVPAEIGAALIKLRCLASYLENEVVRFFSRFPGPFHYLSSLPPLMAPIEIARSTLLGLQHCLHLRKVWSWHLLLPMLYHQDIGVKWCGVQCLGVLAGAGDTLTTSLIEQLMTPEDAAKASLDWQDVCATIALHHTVTFDVESIPDGAAIQNQENIHATMVNNAALVPNNYVDVCGILLPHRTYGHETKIKVEKFVLTSTMERSLRSVALALSCEQALLLEGPPSCGKSALITHVAAKTGNLSDMIQVHLDEQTDSKTLVGSYVCTEKPGEFMWQPGPVTLAVTQGSWLVFENLNMASAEVLAMLIPLAERRKLHIPSRSEDLIAASGFQFIATVTADPGLSGTGAYGNSTVIKDLMGAVLHTVTLNESSLEEKREIIKELYPRTAPLCVYAMRALDIMHGSRQHRGKENSKSVMPRRSYTGSDDSIALVINPPVGRYFCFRDLLKWSCRMATIHGDLITRALSPILKCGGDVDLVDIPIDVRLAALIETIDCFCAGISKEDIFDLVLNAMAAIWSVPLSTIHPLVHLAKPDLKIEANSLLVGRAALSRLNKTDAYKHRKSFVFTGHASRIMERVAAATSMGESVLLVGETGTGKTSIVQEIASRIGAKLVVINVSRQTDATDLIGGYRPIRPQDTFIDLLNRFVELVRDTWKRGNNDSFIEKVTKLARKCRWQQLLKLFRNAIDKVNEDHDASRARGEGKSSKRQRRLQNSFDILIHEQWQKFSKDCDSAESIAAAAQSGFAFGFFEGALVQAVKSGWWLLLDEINLAPPETLERINGLLETNGSLTVIERGDRDVVDRHPDFRLFAAMNPSTDAGKRELPSTFRGRFTELWVGEATHRNDLASIVAGQLHSTFAKPPIEDIVDFYLAAKAAGDTILKDGGGHKPAYNLRTLSRALEYAVVNGRDYGMHQALYDGFAMSFLTQLDSSSARKMEALLQKHLLRGQTLTVRKTPLTPQQNHVLFDGYWVELGNESQKDEEELKFIRTNTVNQHLRNLARAVLLRKYPILLQGPTSSGKTSLVAFLAARTGHRFIRINNHEQTDLQEYLGTYIADENGQLTFQEGILVQAVRHGYWVVLDELNLAPTEVLEALNRLLDDNRELFVPDLREVIKPHPHFMLFATQNPPGIYAGRKTLSRAFRSRFIELHVDDIPDSELRTILERRCEIAPSYAERLIFVMRELQRRRSMSNVFAGRHGYITPRDLFRWANRGAAGYQDLAVNGFELLGERLRNEEERLTVLEVVEKVLKVKVDLKNMYNEIKSSRIQELDLESEGIGRLVWTPTMRRMFKLLGRCLESEEPALLIGETGLGKTSVCQILAKLRGQKLRIINCNHHTESSDFLGGYRPNRSRREAYDELNRNIEYFVQFSANHGLETLQKASDNDMRSLQLVVAEASRIAQAAPEKIRTDAKKLAAAMSEDLARYRALFEWVDGPLTLAMKEGDIILIDELNLAEDAVLERLNSVLEPSRTLTLAEKGGHEPEIIVAHPRFRLIGTMNPGGDFGKKELSPALSNRFTSVWIPPIDDIVEMKTILKSRLHESAHSTVSLIADFVRFYRDKLAQYSRQRISLRDLLTWVEFVNSMTPILGPVLAYAHGACVTLLDGIGLGLGLSELAFKEVSSECERFLRKQLPPELRTSVPFSSHDAINAVERSEFRWGIDPFYLECDAAAEHVSFDFHSPTTSFNLYKILRAMQVRKPVLLEGSPGVGKTSLLSAMAKALGRKFFRINLSEQTDMMDLLGADLPVQGAGAGEFAWSDGPLLQAVKVGGWVLLDELNLANQTILEGLNALLDHRSEVYIPELGKTFKCGRGFRIFGAQNPLREGGGRKGLPKSFLNRFTRVYVEQLEHRDLLSISGSLYQSIPSVLIKDMVEFLQNLQLISTNSCTSFLGGPWDFNLRDLLRWCQMIAAYDPSLPSRYLASYFADTLFIKRLRSERDRRTMRDLLKSHGLLEQCGADKGLYVDYKMLRIGLLSMNRRKTFCDLRDISIFLSSMTEIMEALAQCVSQKLMGILVGPSNTGKTSAVRSLARLNNQELLEMSLNAGTDASDLLGGFEQVDLVRRRRIFVQSVDDLLGSMLYSCFSSSNWKKLSYQIASFAARWSRLKADVLTMTQSIGTAVLQDAEKLIIENEMAGVENSLRHAWYGVSSLETVSSVEGKFEWVDSSFTRAVLEGKWVLINNANLCNPTILDRLNSLMELDGSLCLNECGMTDEGFRVISPHPNFRLFLAYDPRYGEVSRAMRNRGIEIYFMPGTVSGLASEVSCQNGRSALIDIINAQGITGWLASRLVASHEEQRIQAIKLHRRAPSVRELKRWSRMILDLVSRGFKVSYAVQEAFVQVYFPLSGQTREDGAPPGNGLLDICRWASESSSGGNWYQPNSWPVPISTDLVACESNSAMLLRDIGPMLSLIGRSCERIMGDVLAGMCKRPLDFNMVPLSFASIVMVPGNYLAQLCCGSSSSSVLNRGDGPQFELSLAAVEVALYMFLDGTHLNPIQIEYFVHILQRCRELCKRLDFLGHIALLDIHLDQWMKLAKVYSTYPLLDRLTSRIKSTVKQEIGMRLSLDHVKKEMTQSGPDTILQLSCWRFHNIVSRNRFSVVHAVIDALWPFFAAAVDLQEAFLSNCYTSIYDAEEKSVVFQEELNYLYHVTHRDPVLSKMEKCDTVLEIVVFAWLSMRKAAKELLDSLESLDSLERVKCESLRQAVYAVDTSLGITDQDSSRWQFWILAGHPFVPAREEIFQSLASIAALCRGIAVDASGFASLRDLCMSCPNKAIAWDGIINERDGQLLEDMGEYVIASLSSNATLRQEVLHGVALLYTTCVATALPHNGTALSISNELWDATARLIEAEQRNWDLQREGSGFEPAFVLGKSDLYLPSKMLTKSSNRSIQMSLYAFSDASSSKRQLKLLADLDSPLLAMLSSGLELSQKAVNQLQDLAHVIGAMPCRDAREAVPYMLLSWLENDTSRPIPTEIPLESLNSMKQSFVHDAWFSWHRNLWDVVPRSLQSQEVQKASMILDSSILAGPCRLHLCSSASHLCLILQDSSDAPLTDFQAHLMRLQLVARHLCGMLSVGEQDYKSIALAEWKAAGLIAGSTVNSLLSGQLGGDEIDEMVSHLINAKHPNSLSSLQVREKVYSAIVASADENLRQAEPIILPALQMLQHPQVAEPTNLAMTLRGQIFVLLGLARLHMSVPPPGSDPAKVYKLQEQRLLHEVEWDVDIQLLVRQEYEKVPGGPSQASIIQNLLERRNNMLEEAANLAGKSPWRPSPPQYLSLQAEISRFKVNFANKDRLLHTIERMIACERTATEEAKAWMSTAKAMVDHLSHDYPAYRDISQPFQLALEEMRYGFSLIITSLDLQNVPDQRVVEGVIADLLAFPTRMDNHGIITDFTRARNTVSKLIGEPSYNSSRNETKADADYDQKTDAVKLQLELLRTFLWRIAQTWRYAPTKLSQAELLGTFQQICCLLLEYWEIAKAEEARRAEEEAQLFKEKRRDETSLDTSDDEILSMERYRESFSLFSEFIEDDNTMTEEDVGGQKRDAQVSKAVYSARDYLTGDIVKDVIAIQSEIYDDKNLGANDWTTTGEQFLRSHTLGLVMLELAGHKLSAHVDDASITGNLYAACLKGSLLVSNRARNDQTLEEETDLDIWVENPKEARLLLGVLSPVSKRVTDLLADWPDHPVLSQMSAIIDRLLSMSIQSPLKAFLTGIEILMSKAQLWEDTAARHVSLQNELKDVAGLARRWRRLELNSWRTILRKTMTTVAEGAYSGWFHLFRILFDENDLTVESTAHAAEEFIKLSPLGEYSTRLDMIKVFGAHLKAINQSQQAPKDRCSALSSMLINLSLYYGQFLPFVQKQIQSAVAPIEKELEDFVALAKWEDRGYYALQLASEKAHKHLQKLRRKVTDILRQPVSNAIGEAAKMMGLQDLTLTDINGVPNQKIAEYSSSCTTAIDVLTNVDGLPLPSSAASTDKSDVWLFDEWMRPGKYTKNIPNLTGRFSELALDGLRASAQSSRQAAGFANDLASEAVERALLLQKDIEKGAKARKKKALVDFLKALGDLGVSKLRTSVPISHRGPNAWLFLPSPDVCVPSSTLQEIQSKTFMEAWSKVESCYTMSIARIQRLREAAAQPHSDIRPSEAETACRMSEHLLYLVQRGREALSNFSKEMKGLNGIVRFLDDLAVDPTIEPQSASASRLTRNLQTSSQIVRLAHETEELLSAAARLDPSPENSNNLFSASSAARNIWRKLDKCLSNVVSMSNSSVGFDANGQEVFVTPSIINSLNVLNGIINDLSKEISGSEHGEAPGWSHLANVFLSAVSVYQEVDGRPNQGMVNNKHSLADDIEKLVESCLLWAQNESFLARRQESMESVKEAEQGKELVLAYVNAIKRNNTSGLGLVNDRALSCVKKLATLSDSSGDSCLRSNAELLVTTRTLLKVLFAASWHTGCHLMALHRAISKLTYITCGLLATVVQDGFCMPEQEGEEATEGETKEMHGTGLADGDTRGAKDISDEIENEDQVLGAQQAGQETQEQQEQDEKGASRGIEMEDDFEGALEDVQQDVDNDQDESLDEEDGDADRLDQQMGDVGEEGMEVDERLWNEEDVGDDKKEENYDQKQTLDMKDKTNLDYAQGQDKQEEGADDDEDDRKKSTSVEKQERQADDAFDEEDTPGDDPEGNDTAEGQPDEGRAQLEQPDAELQVPENWDLDDGEAPDDEKAGEQGEDEEDRLEELQQAQDGKKEDDVDEDGDSEMKQAQDIENTDNPEANEGGGEQNAAPFDEIDEGQNNEEEKDKEAELIGDDRQDGASVIPEDAVQRGDHGKTGPAEAPMPLEGLTSNDIENQTDATGIDAAVAPAGGEATGPGGGLEDMMVNEQSNYQDREHSQGPQQRDAGKRKNTPQTNPFRNLGSAIEEWRKRLAVVADLDGKPEDDDGGEQEADEQENEVVDQGAHRFLGKDEAPRLDKDAQVLAQATDEQMDTQMAEGDVAMIDNNDDVDDQPAMDGFDDFQANEEKATQTAEKKDMETTGGSKVDKVSRLHGEVPVMKESGSTENDPQPYDSPENDPDLDPTFDAGLESLISSKFQATRIDDEDVLNLKETMLSTDRAAIIREELTKRLEAVQLMGPTAGDTDYGRQVWERCEMLTSSLVGELTEQLRLILEPTIASKMGGEYRTGKRINMKRVITYIASHFRKDKIWMRRSRPDKRKYQVLIAVDNSRSMAETGCGPFALEAVTLIARAMARLEVGEMGVVSFGGPGGAQPLHEFSENFSEADGIRILSTLRFDQDNTIKDKPMEDVILSIDALLENASLKFSSTSGGTGSLHQLVLIVADGRFHEKESLQLAVRNAAERPGVLYAFLVLDNSANSVLDMQSVTFENGIPLFTKYIDSFPFPYYIVLRNTAALPRTLADLLRQWFEMQQGH